MSVTYKALEPRRLAPGSDVVRPAVVDPFTVRMNTSAIEVMTDFERVKPVTVRPAVPIDEALDKMRLAGVRLLLVMDADDLVTGLITATDIHGERPINMIQEQQIRRADISVAQIMTPLEDIDVLTMQTVRASQVGHILATLEALNRQHMLVVDLDAETEAQRVRGVFSSSQIYRQLDGGTQAARVRASAA